MATEVSEKEILQCLLKNIEESLIPINFDERKISPSSIVKPRSAITLSFGCQNLSSEIPDLRTISLSDIDLS